MPEEILSQKQKEIFPSLACFSEKFGLVGGTAIAFQLGHRQSIDFDLTSNDKIKTLDIRKKISEIGEIEAILVDDENEYSLVMEGIKFTFSHYPFPLDFSFDVDGIIKSPDLISLGAMKAYALGRRAKWKDYVDLFFIFQKLGSIQPIVRKAQEIFGVEFNEKNFRVQLAYFEDIDYSEKVIFVAGFEIADEKIKEKLKELAFS